MTRARDVTIRRTGRAALLLRDYGLCAQASSRAAQGARQNRWHEIELWSDDTHATGPDQRHCLVVRYVTRWEGELGHDWAEILRRDEIATALAAYSPTAHVVAYPPGEQYDQRRDRLLADLRLGYEHAVSDLLDQARVWEIGDR